MRRFTALSVVLTLFVASVVATSTAAPAPAPAPSSIVSISVSQGSLQYDQKALSAKAGLVEIRFTNNSAAPHNVSLEHGGEFEFGASLTIKKGSIYTFLRLAKGTYHLYSSVGTDEDKGMSATLTVK
jgi:plastocyanin